MDIGFVARHRWWWQPLGVSLLLVLMFVGLYVGFQRNPEPHGVPVAAAGTELAGRLAAGTGQALDVRPVADRATGDALLRSGDAVAALTAVPGRLQLDVAGASGTATVAATEKVVSAFARQAGTQLTITDVLPLSTFDSRGLAGFYVSFGVTLASFALAQNMLAAARRVRLRHRMTALTAFALLSGVVAATLAGPVLGALPAPLVPLALTLALLSAATALATKALGSWLGAIGIPASTLLLLTIGNSTSGGTLGVALLPGPARWISAVLPPGAAIRAVADLDYFHGAHLTGPLLTLAAWIVAAAVLVHFKERRRDAPVAVATGTLSGDVVPGQAPATLVVTDERGDVVTHGSTDRSGRFEFGDLPVGPATLTVLADGYQPASRALALAAGQPASVRVGLVPLPGPPEREPGGAHRVAA